MKIFQDIPLFRPVTIKLENQDEYDQLLEIVSAVAANRINNTEQVIKAAQVFKNMLYNVED
jgi:hypothetical protein